MNNDLCPICSGTTNLLSYAVIAPWIEEILSLPITATTLRKCERCDFNFFTYRYSDQQMGLLYRGYRGTEYFRSRSNWEFWYSKKINDFWTIPSNVDIRQSRLNEALQEMEINISQVSSCLDFGGDEGQFLPENLPREKRFVLDLSSDEQSDKFIRISSLAQLPKKVELIMCCMVLEHASEPRKMISDLVIASSDAVYIEVPQDVFRVSKFHKSISYRNYLLTIRKYKRLFIVIDFISGFTRNYLGFIPWFGVVKQSEHINYFSQVALSKIMEPYGSNHQTKVWKKAKIGFLNIGQMAGTFRKAG